MKNSPDIVRAPYPLERRTKQIWAFSEPVEGGWGLKGSWQEYTCARTHAETHQMGASCGPLTHFKDLAMGVPPQTLSSPSRSVALFVIVIRTLFVKGSLAVCSRWWVYVCTCVYLQKSAGWRSAVTSLPLGFLSHPVNAAPLTQPFSKVIVYREKLHLITPVITSPASLSHQTTSNPQARSFYSTKWWHLCMI